MTLFFVELFLKKKSCFDSVQHDIFFFSAAEMTNHMIGLKIQMLKWTGLTNPEQRTTITRQTGILLWRDNQL
jgi:hypothetical protein